MIDMQQQVDNQVIKLITKEGRVYLLKPLALYDLIKPMVNMLLSGGSNQTDTPEQKRVAQLFKVGVKGLFIAGGPVLLDMIFGGKDHPKPGKKDDILAWYADVLTMVAIKQVTTRSIHVQTAKNDEGPETYDITGYTTESLPTGPVG